MAEATQKAPQKAALEDVMVAMDVVDTLRHQQGIAERELNNHARRERLLKRLKDMYVAQGIDVPEAVLLEGIAALEEERFRYTPVERSWRTKLAELWVSRKRWGRPIGFLSVIGAALWAVYFVLEILPQRQLADSLPLDVRQTLKVIEGQAKNPAIVPQAQQLANAALSSLRRDDVEEARSQLHSLQDIAERLSQDFVIRIVSRPNENSAVWRIPPGNTQARNYYLIVEAVDRNNRVVEINVINEEDNKAERKKTWGLRVSEETFYKIASDKQDDGIIQRNKVGVKRAGYLKPEFSVPTTGATITEW